MPSLTELRSRSQAGQIVSLKTRIKELQEQIRQLHSDNRGDLAWHLAQELEQLQDELQFVENWRE
jgi:chaperonin cofactor prefoldin